MTPVQRDVKDIPPDMEATTAPYVNRVAVAVEKQGTSLHDDYVTMLG